LHGFLESGTFRDQIVRADLQVGKNESPGRRGGKALGLSGLFVGHRHLNSGHYGSAGILNGAFNDSCGLDTEDASDWQASK
jgi:hypothetical protein